MTGEPGKLLRIFICEKDQYQGKPLYEAIVERCRELKLAGVIVFRGLEGFGESTELRRPHLLAHDQPVVITIAERPDRANEAIPVLQSMMRSGVIAVSDVEMTIINKSKKSE